MDMTKRELEITDTEEILDILERGQVLHLGLSDDDMPYVVPMNYGYTYENGKLVLYIHGAKTGYKYEVIKKNNKVSFSIECDVLPFEGKVACQYGTSYACVMGQGKAFLVEDAKEKMKALSILMKTQTGKDFTFDEKLVSIVNVVRIEVSQFTGKKRPLPPRMK